MEEIGWAMRGKNVVKEEDERGKGEKMERFAVPLFLSDGITENYIARSYPNSGTAISSENERYKTSQIEAGRQDILVVRDVHFGANAGDEVILRIATFRSQLRISVEWKEDLFDGVMVMKFLEEIKCVLLSLL
ncbi:hypothetical protein HYALB_00011327 [Hymenoscyphus albidus]|uniref:Uncharacterized protein n=1 Tax=Hymenoscyphus albidus TaxID=595503 RepID=A0A9N9LIM6_9HELO|nr:hypothetical protein HYALB_00011327 [Hymenoscyphus albidus]